MLNSEALINEFHLALYVHSIFFFFYWSSGTYIHTELLEIPCTTLLVRINSINE